MSPLVNLAKQAAEIYIKDNVVIIPPKELPKEFLNRQAGVFVTIEKKGELSGLPRSEPKVLLRGCIGTYLPTRKNIAEEVIYNAIAAATEDYRFDSIAEKELPYLSFTIYILSEPELVMELDPVKWASPKIRKILFDRVNPKKFGIIVKHGTKCGLLLPDLEGVDTIEQQISICCQKGRIDLNKDKIIIYKFTVEKYTQ